MTPVVSYPEDTVLTARQVAEALQISKRTLDKMDYLPTIYLGKRSRRYRWGSVLRVLEERAA